MSASPGSPRTVRRRLPPGRDDDAFRSRQLITYLGNKRALLPQIAAACDRARRRLGKQRLAFLDLFSGSGVVSRLMKSRASLVVANDLEDYAAVASRCYLANRSAVDRRALAAAAAEIDAQAGREDAPRGFIAELYAPRDERRITSHDRVFYTRTNALRLDACRQLIAAQPTEWHDLLLGPLLAAASVHANTAGVFKGFYKDRRTGLGQFGGSHRDALGRITGTIRLEPPVSSAHECDSIVLQDDAVAAAGKAPPVDVAYLDPPYNQHPYGSNYFMLNLLVRYRRPERISRVSGIPADWNRSPFNVRAAAPTAWRRLIEAVDAPFLIVSANNEGFVSPEALRAILQRAGRVDEIALPYPAFRGSRSFAARPVRVTEHLFMLERR